MFSAVDIKSMRKNQPENLMKLLAKSIDRIFVFLTRSTNVEEVINSVRILIRILPYCFEEDGSALSLAFFWKRFDDNPDVPSLGKKLLEAAVDLLYVSNFTLVSVSETRLQYIPWRKGFFSDHDQTINEVIMKNRTIVLQLLMTLLSNVMYVKPEVLLKRINPWSDCLLSMDENVLKVLFSSLLNTILAYNANGWKIPYSEMLYQNTTEEDYISLCFYTLISVLDIHPSSSNYFLNLFDKVDSFEKIICGLEAFLDYSVGLKPGCMHIEVFLLLWKLLESEKFMKFILKERRYSKILYAVFYHSNLVKSDQLQSGLFNLLCFILISFCSQVEFLQDLNLPHNFDLPGIKNTPGTIGDFLISVVIDFIHNAKNALFIPNLVECFYFMIMNCSLYCDTFSTIICGKLIGLFKSQKEKNFRNHLLESFQNVVRHKADRNFNLLYAICCEKSLFLECPRESPIMLLFNLVLVEIERITEDQHVYDETIIMEYLKSVVLPVEPVNGPSHVFSRDAGVKIWFTSNLFGILFLKFSNPPIWFGSDVKLFNIKTI